MPVLRSLFITHRFASLTAAPSAAQTRCFSFACSPESLSSFAAAFQSTPGGKHAKDDAMSLEEALKLRAPFFPSEFKVKKNQRKRS